MDCNVVGDSIAVGLLPFVNPPCQVEAQTGARAAQLIGRVKDADVLVLSMGSNDSDPVQLRQALLQVRHLATHRVIWILPAHQMQRAEVLRIAHERGDTTLAFEPGPDGVHPRSYRELAAFVSITINR